MFTMISTAVVTLLLVSSSGLTAQTRGTIEVADTRLAARGGLSSVAAFLNTAHLAQQAYEPTDGRAGWAGSAGVEYLVLAGEATPTGMKVKELVSGTDSANYFNATKAGWEATARTELTTDVNTWVVRVEYKTEIAPGTATYFHLFALSKASQDGIVHPANPTIRSAQCALVPGVSNPWGLGLATGRGNVTFTGGGNINVVNPPAGTTQVASTNGTLTGNN
jgi:hypothetical protein